MFPAGNEYPDTFEQMLLKMFTMLLGEIELMTIPFYPSGWMRIVEFVFFLSFLILMVLVLQNLLNALAIKDTEEMLNISEQEKLFSLMEVSNFWEFFLNQIGIDIRVLEDFSPTKEVYFPIFHERCRNEKIFVGHRKGEKPSFLDWRRYRYFYRFMETLNILKLFTINKEMAELSKKIIVSKDQSQEGDNIEEIAKVKEIGYSITLTIKFNFFS